MPNISRIINNDGVPYNIKDNRASHYLGRINSDDTPSGVSITLVTGETVTAKNNDWINLQTKPDAFIWNGTEWISFGGVGTDALVELVDGGAKNIAVPLDVASREDLTITNDKGQYTITGTITRSFTGYLFRPAEPLQLTTDCIIIGAEQLTGLVYMVAYSETAGSNMKYDSIGTQNKILPAGAVISYIYAQQNNAGTAISAKINLMLCTVADYAISPKFVPYAPTNRELYETKVDPSELHAFLPNITSSTTIRDYVDSLSKGAYTAFIANASNPSDSPINANCFVNIYVYSTTTAAVELIPIATVEAARTYTMRKIVGTWSSWYKFEGTAVT